MGGNDSCSSSCSSEGSSSGNGEKRKRGRKRWNVRRHPVFRGVRQRKGSKWVSEVREPHKKTRIWLGTFPTPEMAARAYDVAVLALRGSSALLNFPDSASILLPPNCSSAKDIRTAAVAVAHAHSCNPTTAYSHSDWSLATNTSEPAVLGCSSTQLHEDNKESEPIDDEVNNPLFIDEEALFNMPGLLHSMAQGLLISPPPMQTQIDPDDQDDSNMNNGLWD